MIQLQGILHKLLFLLSKQAKLYRHVWMGRVLPKHRPFITQTVLEDLRLEEEPY